MAKKFDFKKIGLRAAGAVGGGAAGSVLNKMLPTLDPKIRSLIKIGAGIVLPELAPKSAIISDAGIALAGVGAFEMANTMINPGTGVQGIGDPEYLVNGDDEYKVEGDDDDEVSGDDDATSGVDDAVSGEEEF